ncbi:hypothetical protein [Novosphingobium sp. 9]|uniref:hypothetical protein n=1 Tax=Novosphingobium sp. 9 TaxID=2025349 RepID=UPI0021B6288A|nr:hypothetical protein [Novosphingobium sp. 9]
MRVVSVPGRRVVDPLSRRVVDEAGILVNPHDPTWNRLVRDGDVKVATDAPATAPAAKE